MGDEEMDTSRRATEAETGCSDAARFELELEFVQCLANPKYLNWLAQNRQLDDPAFINYLKYLQYWRQPQYAKFLIYPHCLHFLELLQKATFRKVLADPRAAEFIDEQQAHFWKYYRNSRLASLGPAETVAAAGEADATEVDAPVGPFTVNPGVVDPPAPIVAEPAVDAPLAT